MTKPRDLAALSRHRAQTFACDKGFPTRAQAELRELELSGIRRGDLQARPGDAEGKRLFDERWGRK